MTDLKSKKWNQIEAEIQFRPQFLKSNYNVPVFIATDGECQFGKRAARVCIRCKEMFPLKACPNCGSAEYVPGLTTGDVSGLFCFKCEKGLSSWECPACHTSNPINKSLAVEKSGCFIATAVYGSPEAPEVRLLRYFRDTVLIQNTSGRWFVRAYYSASPTVARIILRNRTLQRLVRVVLIQPVVHMVRRRLER